MYSEARPMMASGVLVSRKSGVLVMYPTTEMRIPPHRPMAQALWMASWTIRSFFAP